MTARDIQLTRNDRMREAVAAIHAIAKTQKISSDQANQSVTVEASAREAGLAEWLIGELDKPTPGPGGHGYIMPTDVDDVTVVIGDVHVGAPISSAAAHVATPTDLQELVNAIRVLGDMPKAEAYAPTNALVWRGKVWQSDFALWLLRELASPPAANWTVPVSYHLDKTSPSVRIFYFAAETNVQELRQLVSTIRSKAPAQKGVVIGAERAIVLRGTDIEVATAERIVAASRR